MDLKIDEQIQVGYVELPRNARMSVSYISRNGYRYIAISRERLVIDRKTKKESYETHNSIWIPLDSTEKIVNLIGKAFKKFSGKSIPRQISLFDVPPQHENVTPFFNSDIWTAAMQLGAVYADLFAKFDKSQMYVMNKLTKSIGNLYIHGIRERIDIYNHFANQYGDENARRLKPMIDTAYDGIKDFFDRRSR